MDLSKFNLIKEKKGYRLVSFGKKLSFDLNNVTIPFGIEEYKGKIIVNLEFKNIPNETYNNLIYIKNVNETINNILTQDKIPFAKTMEFTDDFINKKYYDSLKQTNDVYYLRCSINNKNDCKFYKIINNKKVECVSSECEKKVCDVKLELYNIWFFSDSYGLNWNIKEVIIKD